MDGNSNSLNWFEISVTDINRAKTFYEHVFGIEMQVMEMMGMHMAFFPWTPGNGKATGALVQGEMHKPSMDGAKIYLNADPDLTDALGRVEEAGGQIMMPKTQIDEFGFMAFFVDSEGNAVALHSNR
ncbi:MAG: VOC family protein [Bacteroidetes bacterium]|nr:VOC family protein [Bacteroidota bacterium]